MERELGTVSHFWWVQCTAKVCVSHTTVTGPFVSQCCHPGVWNSGFHRGGHGRGGPTASAKLKGSLPRPRRTSGAFASPQWCGSIAWVLRALKRSGWAHRGHILDVFKHRYIRSCEVEERVCITSEPYHFCLNVPTGPGMERQSDRGRWSHFKAVKRKRKVEQKRRTRKTFLYTPNY